MEKRIGYIDIAKAFAIIIIIIGHTIVHSAHCGKIFYFLYTFNIALFFIISGLTFKIQGDFKTFFKKKFVRIMIPYFIWSLLFIVPYIIFGKSVSSSLGTTQSFDIIEILKNTIYGNGLNDALKQNTSLWFLPALFSMEIIYYFIIKMANDKYDFIKLPILIAIGCITSNYLSFVLPWGINTVLQVGCTTFFVGYLMQKYNILNKLFHPIIMVLILLVGVVFSILNNSKISYVNYEYGNYFITAIIGVSISILVLYLSYIIRNNKILEYIGKNTMGILIFHKIVVLIFQSKLGKISKLLKNSCLPMEVLIGLLITGLSILFSLMITQIITKTLPICIGKKFNRRKEYET